MIWIQGFGLALQNHPVRPDTSPGLRMSKPKMTGWNCLTQAKGLTVWPRSTPQLFSSGVSDHLGPQSGTSVSNWSFVVPTNQAPGTSRTSHNVWALSLRLPTRLGEHLESPKFPSQWLSPAQVLTQLPWEQAGSPAHCSTCHKGPGSGDQTVLGQWDSLSTQDCEKPSLSQGQTSTQG